jgi:hypothetical protein
LLWFFFYEFHFLPDQPRPWFAYFYFPL